MRADRLTLGLRAARLARGLTQEQLATAVGITQGEYSHLELGDHAPSGLRKALRIARVLGSTVEALWHPSLTIRVTQHQPPRPALSRTQAPRTARKSAGRAKR
jgi:transcriptional regulator with XRE-family HTH domain